MHLKDKQRALHNVKNVTNPKRLALIALH